MNKIHKSQYNEALGTWVAVPEIAKGHGRGGNSTNESVFETAASFGLAKFAFSAITLATVQIISGTALAEQVKWKSTAAVQSCNYDLKVDRLVCSGYKLGKAENNEFSVDSFTDVGADDKGFVGFGSHNISRGNNNIIFGKNNKITEDKNARKDNVAILGNNIIETSANSVFLGNETAYIKEEVDPVKNKDGRVIKNKYGRKTYSGVSAGWSAESSKQASKDALRLDNNDNNFNTKGVVSVGSKNGTRRIQGVAPGLVGDNSTDAINGAQLNAAWKEIDALKMDQGWVVKSYGNPNYYKDKEIDEGHLISHKIGAKGSLLFQGDNEGLVNVDLQNRPIKDSTDTIPTLTVSLDKPKLAEQLSPIMAPQIAPQVGNHLAIQGDSGIANYNDNGTLKLTGDFTPPKDVSAGSRLDNINQLRKELRTKESEQHTNEFAISTTDSKIADLKKQLSVAAADDQKKKIESSLQEEQANKSRLENDKANLDIKIAEIQSNISEQTKGLRGLYDSSLSNGNIAVVQGDSDHSLKVKLASSIKEIESITFKESNSSDVDGLSTKTVVKLSKEGLINGGHQIKEVASGGDWKKDEDAHNAANMGDLSRAIASVKFAPSTLSIQGDSGAAKFTETGVLNLKGGSSNPDLLTSGNIGIVNSDSNSLEVKLNKNLNNISSINFNDKGEEGDIGINLNNRKITNLADGKDAGDAVNVSQLNKVEKNLNDRIDKWYWLADVENADVTAKDKENAKSDAKKTTPANKNTLASNTPSKVLDNKSSSSSKGVPDIPKNGVGYQDKVVFRNKDSNIVLKRADNENKTLPITIDLADDIKVANSIKVGSHSTIITTSGIEITDGPSLVKNGVNAGGKKVINAANGEISATSTDGINGSQLHEQREAVADIIGGIVYDDNKKQYVVKEKGAGKGIGGTGEETIDAAIRSIKVKNTYATVKGDGDNGGAGNITVTPTYNEQNVPTYTVASKEDVKYQTVKIVKGADGSGGIDAGDTKITNVHDGAIAKNSKDAVNGGQLYNLRQDLDDVDKRARSGIASAMATAGLPQAYLPGKSMVSASAGYFHGEGALAVGISSISDNGKWLVKANANANRKDLGVTLGVGYQW